jgi:hypothetical protein
VSTSTYRVEERHPSAFAVIKTGPRGGKKVINVYKYRQTAETVRDALTKAGHLEA